MNELQVRQFEFCSYLRSGFTGAVTLRGLSATGAEAVTGNGTQESLITPAPAPGSRLDHGSKGILQQREERLSGTPDSMVEWCTANFGTWTTIQAQAAFTLYEIDLRDKRSGTHLGDDLRAGTKSL